MKFLYIGTIGASDPTTASLALHMAANGSVEVGHETSVLLAGHSTDIFVGDNMNQMKGVGVPPVKDLLEKLKASGVTVYV